jgi:hypothetical protein
VEIGWQVPILISIYKWKLHQLKYRVAAIIVVTEETAQVVERRL